MKNQFKHIFVFTLFFLFSLHTFAQIKIEKEISDSLTKIVNNYCSVGKVNEIKLVTNKKAKTLVVSASEIFGQMPFRVENVNRIYSAIRKITEAKYPEFVITIIADGKEISELIPVAYRQNITYSKPTTSQTPLIRYPDKPFEIQQGLQGKNIALWHSHGLHFVAKTAKWSWQRPILFNQVEDLLTYTFVVPFLTPMFENAGAQLFIPRERDINPHEIIVDNDRTYLNPGNSRFREFNDRESWVKGGPGFALTQKNYIFGQNPFQTGTFSWIKSITDNNESSRIEWVPDIPEKRMYAVYISYRSLPNSTQSAHYTVYHAGGTTSFVVNQQMYSGSWLYLGHFLFEKGRSHKSKVVLTNLSNENESIVTADAVRFGGGMGNMARATNDSVFINNKDWSAFTSQSPRFTEGSRYWLQWAGVPDSVYSRTKNTNDYLDDFQSRGFWVNYLAGGSKVLPLKKGLNIPIDLSLAIHTDAGKTAKDSIIGTLGICTVKNTEGIDTFADGRSRWTSRDLTDIIQTQIVEDARRTFRNDWTRRGIWNKSYSESRVPEVPTMLIELLSHQNKSDVLLAENPLFRFTVARSIYKGVLKYLSAVNGTSYQVQPLPVKEFESTMTDKNIVKLKWKASIDSLEPTATAEKYILYIKVDDEGFDNGRMVNQDSIILKILPGKVYSFKVTAVNQGGESFPSETLMVYKHQFEMKNVLVINGCNPINLQEKLIADTALQVPVDKENVNTLPDFPFNHAKKIKSFGTSFTTVSPSVFLQNKIQMEPYDSVYYISGKNTTDRRVISTKSPEFKTFPLALHLLLKTTK